MKTRSVGSFRCVTLLYLSVFLGSGLSGCAQMTKQDTGALTGGLVGGLVGSRFGSGSGQLFATLGGAAVGAYLGNSIGKMMDDVDRLKMSKALEQTQTGQSTAWKNPDTGYQYRVTPTKTYTYKGRGSSQPCREYTTTVTIGGKKQIMYGKACRKADGSWKQVS